MAKNAVLKQCGGVMVVASAVFFGGCAEKKEVPLLPADAILAAYATDATQEAPVMKQFQAAFEAQMKKVKEAQKKGNPDVAEKLDGDPLKTYLGIDAKSVEWSLFSMGTLVRPAEGQEMVVPDMAWVMRGTFEADKVVSTLTQRLQAEAPKVTLVASQLNGVPVWTVKSDDFDDVEGLRPCMAFRGKRLMLVASNEKALQKMLDLYDGKGQGLPKGAPLGRVLETGPALVSRMMLVNIQELINKMVTAEERKELVKDEKMAGVINALRELQIETRIVDEGRAIELSIRMECADEANAQTLQELWITAKTGLSFFINMAVEQNPEMKVASEWLSKIRVSVTGKATTMSLTCTPKDIQDLDIEKLTGQKEKKADPQGKEKKANDDE